MTRKSCIAATRGVAVGFGALSSVVGLAACSGGTSTSADTTTPPSSATGLVVSTTTTEVAPTTSEASTPTSTSASTPAAPTPCATSELTGSVAQSAGGGTAGGYGLTITLANAGSRECTLTGYPGVSFVGDGNGTQIGAAARRTPTGTPPSAVRLPPGGSATAAVQVTEAGNYDAATCEPSPVDGFRVYPPDNTAALFISYPNATGCRSPQAPLLSVGPMSG